MKKNVSIMFICILVFGLFTMASSALGDNDAAIQKDPVSMSTTNAENVGSMSENYIKFESKKKLSDAVLEADQQGKAISHFETEILNPNTGIFETIGLVADLRMSNEENAKFLAAYLNGTKNIKDESITQNVKGKIGKSEFLNSMDRKNIFSVESKNISNTSIQDIEVTGISYNDEVTNNSMSTLLVNSDDEDRQDRGSNGYVPQEGFVGFIDDFASVDGVYWRNTYVGFEWTSSGLNTLVQDSNETIEVQVSFYNYRDVSGTDEDEAWMYFNRFMDDDDTLPGYDRYEGYLYATNLPSSYPDTKASDPDDNNDGYLDEVNFSIGVHDASDLNANTFYYWRILNPPGDNTLGWFKLEAQRGYVVNLVSDMAFNVFSEPNESASDYRISPFSARNNGIKAGDDKLYYWDSTGGLTP